MAQCDVNGNSGGAGKMCDCGIRRHHEIQRRHHGERIEGAVPVHVRCQVGNPVAPRHFRNLLRAVALLQAYKLYFVEPGERFEAEQR